MSPWSSNFSNLAKEIADELGQASRVINTDAKGRTRAAIPFKWIDTKANNKELDDFFWTEAAFGTGSGAFDASKSSYMSSAPANGDGFVRQVKTPAPYSTSSSQLIEFSIIGFGLEAGGEKRIGYYTSSIISPFNTAYDGIMFIADGITGEHRLEVHHNGTTVISLPRNSTNWLDPLDGSGPSGVTIDFNNLNVFAMELAGISSNSLTMSVFIGGAEIVFLQYNHTNTTDNVMFAHPQKPLRYELRNTSGSQTMWFESGQVSNEGNLGIDRIPESINAGSLAADDIDANVIGTTYAIIGIRLKPDFMFSVVSPVGATLYAGTGDEYRFEGALNPVVANSGSLVWNSSPTGNFEWATGDIVNSPSNTTITGGRIIFSQHGSGDAAILGNFPLLFRAGSELDGTIDELWLMVTPIDSGAGLDIFAAVNIEMIL